MNKIFIIKEEFAESRLDRWFKRNVHETPQSLIEKHIRKGNIKVNNKREKSSYKLKKNDQIHIKNFYFNPNINKKNNSNYKASKKDITFSSSIFVENN